MIALLSKLSDWMLEDLYPKARAVGLGRVLWRLAIHVCWLEKVLTEARRGHLEFWESYRRKLEEFRLDIGDPNYCD
jgi:hypothetical protein